MKKMAMIRIATTVKNRRGLSYYLTKLITGIHRIHRIHHSVDKVGHLNTVCNSKVDDTSFAVGAGKGILSAYERATTWSKSKCIANVFRINAR